MTLASDLDKAIRAVCPIDGVSVGDPSDKTTWSADPSEDATEEQKAAIRGVIDSFQWADVPDSVSSRQFKLQLLAAGLLDQVDAWIASQPKAVQIAYEYSGTFVRTEPMMAAGFTAMGFTEEQIDTFFTEARLR